ncbi:MAG: hypothetical protein ABGY72_03465, partial [bacterium]
MTPRAEDDQERASPATAGGGVDRVTAWVDRWSERVSFELFRLGLYVTMPALVVLVTLDVALRY